MKRRPFNSPFLMMLIIALIALLLDLQSLKYMRMANAPGSVDLWFFKFSLLYVLEAFVYWRLRYKIEEPGNAWTHVFLLLIGVYALSFVNIIYNREIVDNILSGHPSARLRWLQNTIMFARIGCFVLAHVFFGITIVKALKRRIPLPDDRQRHLLDDIR